MSELKSLVEHLIERLDRYEVMSNRSRAISLVGDMPWVTAGMTIDQERDLIDQIETAFEAVAWQTRLEAMFAEIRTKP